MTQADRWLLPDGIEELLPPSATAAERMRRKLLDVFVSWGYELVMPPLIEYTDSLLVGLGQDIDLLTFKSVDQLTGRLLGVRADITPQVARIDAHSLARSGPTRLCYAGTVLHTKPTSLTASRAPIQIGAELYGDDSFTGDVEIISLMLATLRQANISEVTIDLGHVGIYSELLKAAQLSTATETLLFDAMQRKADKEVAEILSQASIDASVAKKLAALCHLHGNSDVLVEARQLFSEPAILEALALLEKTAEVIASRSPEVTVYFDLCELRGYHYHTGLVFAAYAPGSGQALANGGRYDHIGEVFGRARAATGFNADLKALMNTQAAAIDREQITSAIFAPADASSDLWQLVEQLREQGECVIGELANGKPDSRCDREIKQVAGKWQVMPLSRER